MTIVITAFERSPDGGRGLARDTRVRWALENAAIKSRFPSFPQISNGQRCSAA